jgi:hypothetical protein
LIKCIASPFFRRGIEGVESFDFEFIFKVKTLIPSFLFLKKVIVIIFTSACSVVRWFSL